MSTLLRAHKGRGFFGLSIRAKGLFLSCRSLAVPFGLTTPILAQVPSSNGQSTSMSDWVQNARDDAAQAAIQFSLDHFTLEQSYIDWGKASGIDDLQIATWQFNYSDANVGFMNNLLMDAKTDAAEVHMGYPG